jgi:hypothetical protein
MFIRQTRTNNKATGEGYFTYRLVRTQRIGGKVRQITVLNLGRHFPIKQEDWPLLSSRIEQLLNPQGLLLPLPCPEAIERAAQRYFAQLVAQAPTLASAAGQPIEGDAGPASKPFPPLDFQEVDVDSLRMTQPRSVGVEQVGLHALSELGLLETLKDLGVNGIVQASIIGSLIGRMGQPGSERATWNWLQHHSALGELLDFDFLSISHMGLYRASDVLMKHREAIEARLFGSVQTLFDLPETVTLYDLSNTYFEGEASDNAKARRGRSKEKRSDCPLVTLGLVLDGSGFVRRSQTFAGNVSEPGTLSAMLAGLGTPAGALVVMDAGIATEANVSWLAEHGYRYLVVRRGRAVRGPGGQPVCGRPGASPRRSALSGDEKCAGSVRSTAARVRRHLERRQVGSRLAEPACSRQRVAWSGQPKRAVGWQARFRDRRRDATRRRTRQFPLSTDGSPAARSERHVGSGRRRADPAAAVRNRLGVTMLRSTSWCLKCGHESFPRSRARRCRRKTCAR